MSFDSPQSIVIANRVYPVTADTLTQQVNALANMMLVVDAYESRIVALEAERPSVSMPVRGLDANFVVDFARNALVFYTIDLDVSVAISGTQTAQVDLMVDSVSNATVKNKISLILGLLSLTVHPVHQKVLMGYVPAGSVVNLTTSGAGTSTLVQSMEVLL